MMNSRKIEKFEFYNNNFVLIRYWAAVSIMIAHFIWQYPRFRGISKSMGEDLNFLTSILNFFPGVVVFFAMSGYLIFASLDRNSEPKEYFSKRVVRLFPELWVCTLVNFLFLIFAVPKMLDKSIIVWLATQIFGIANTPECLKEFATGSVNGALWTIFTELQFYIVIFFIYKYLKKLSTVKWLCLLTFFAGLNVVHDYLLSVSSSVILKLVERTFFIYFIWFLMGCFVYVKREKILPWLKKYFWVLIAIYAMYKLSGAHTPGHYADIFIGIICPLITIGGAYMWKKIEIKKDITYGIFLYHWLVMNCMIHYGVIEKCNFGISLSIFVSCTLILAYLSNKFIGQTASLIIKKF